MKKFLSVVLTVIMVVSMFAVCASAATPEGTAITDAAGFAAMTADGKYYLANDITLTETYADTFSGTLDGNGKTITISKPMFAKVAGATFKNFTIEGAIGTEATPFSGNCAALAVLVGAEGNVIENVTNNADIISNGNNGGFYCRVTIITVGDVKQNVTIAIKNSVNNGDMISTGTAKVCAGFVGMYEDNNKDVWQTVTIEDCTNNGNIVTAKGNTAASIAGAAAGFMGNCSFSKVIDTVEKDVVVIKNCINNGEIDASGVTAAKDYHGAAGIAASLGGNITIYNCKNAGNIKAGKANAGGILGANRQGKYGATIENCDNVGTITASGVVGQIFGWGALTEGKVTVKNCYFTGTADDACGDGKKNTDDPTKNYAFDVIGSPAAKPNFEDKKDSDTTGDTSMVIAIALVGVAALAGTTVIVKRRKEN